MGGSGEVGNEGSGYWGLTLDGSGGALSEQHWEKAGAGGTHPPQVQPRGTARQSDFSADSPATLMNTSLWQDHSVLIPEPGHLKVLKCSLGKHIHLLK